MNQFLSPQMLYQSYDSCLIQGTNFTHESMIGPEGYHSSRLLRQGNRAGVVSKLLLQKCSIAGFLPEQQRNGKKKKRMHPFFKIKKSTRVEKKSGRGGRGGQGGEGD
eukprot:TRINITY_DN2743_c0_g1_i1.p2 TRINITY_DN2743_c0_g1~~TRINITY_DN2743_c0_g1_i1.p2  ORF type:complete len:107 (-),score=8.33 TRINITY_DN2743_c0_g1_i1:275-595(-)